MINVLTRISKVFVSIFILYTFWFKEVYGNYPLILYGSVIVATALVLLDILSGAKKIKLYSFVTMLFVFGLYSFLSGIWIARDVAWFNSILTTYLAFAVVCFDVCYISDKTSSTEWILNILLITSSICAIQTIFFGGEYRTEVIVRTMSSTNNPNALGFVMILGIFSLISRKKYVADKLLIKAVVLLAFLYVIILTGSRKTLLSALLIVALWVYSLLKTEKGFSNRKISIIAITTLIAVVGVYYGLTRYITTSSYARLMIIGTGANSRAELYRDAIEFWKTSPIFGIGFGQYQIWSAYRLYSHSSYAEILSCTGIIGTIIFFGYMLHLLIKLFKQALRRNEDCYYDYFMCFVMFIIELILGVGQIYIYDFPHLLILSYLSMSPIFIKKEYEIYQKEIDAYGQLAAQKRFRRYIPHNRMEVRNNAYSK